ACRSATGMTFGASLIDNVPTHTGFLFASPDGTPVAHFRVYRDGVLLLSEPDYLGDIFTVPQAASTYRVVVDVDRSLVTSNLSTALVTDVTFRSGAGQGTPMPPNWICLTAATCRVLPVLRAEVNLHQTMQGTLPVGTPSAEVSVEHIRGAVA